MRVFLECREDSAEPAPHPGSQHPLDAAISFTYAIDVVFPGPGLPCRFEGVDNILALKKFYKLIHSLEERAREHGNRRERVVESAEGLVEHLAYTRNARDFTGQPEPRQSAR